MQNCICFLYKCPSLVNTNLTINNKLNNKFNNKHPASTLDLKHRAYYLILLVLRLKVLYTILHRLTTAEIRSSVLKMKISRAPT